MAVLGLGAAAAACATPNSMPAARPLVIAHRGASGRRPEHTLMAYRLAIAQGADYIEPDLVLTRDGALVCRHENEISGTTDVARRPEFADRKRRRTVDWEEVEGWFTEDFTLAELKTLRCRERLPELRPANTTWDGAEAIPTFEDVLDLAIAESARLGRTIGVYPETKHPSHFEALGLSFEAPLLAALGARGLDRADAPVFIQSFETGNLQRLAGRTRVRLVQLIAADGMPYDHLRTGIGERYADMIRDDGLKRIAAYAAGLGPQKSLIIPRDAEGRSAAPSDLVIRAHDAGLVVHPWTFRNENQFLPLEMRRGAEPGGHGEAVREIRQFLDMGVDGLFTDFPDTAVEALSA
jgi:glycerophosphoryl diester phosphodiesterase